MAGRVAVLAGRPAGLLGQTSGSLNGSPEQVTAVRIEYPDAVVATVRHPSEIRPGLTIETLVDETVTQFEGAPDDVDGDSVEAWLPSRRRRGAPVLEASPEPLVIAGTPYDCLRMAPRDGMSARVATLDGLAVIVAGRDIDHLELSWA
ncbi:hypothetical protein [Actinacidiphila yeochonensis]|uniref:hypothetical protein n=1 Tax=Actinacidiphila yeochonensis TaxID=89050 RepID=UPI0012FF3FF7|nr:hypothetical protein [Actinacidiphila yeochonensis]